MVVKNAIKKASSNLVHGLKFVVVPLYPFILKLTLIKKAPRSPLQRPITMAPAITLVGVVASG